MSASRHRYGMRIVMIAMVLSVGLMLGVFKREADKARTSRLKLKADVRAIAHDTGTALPSQAAK